MKTDAVVFTSPEQIEVQEVTLPEMGAEDVLIELEYSSISIGTERWALLGKLKEPGQPLMTPFPHIPGYQAAGIVREVGKKATGVKPGDRVFSYGGRKPENWSGSCWGGHMRHHIADYRNVLKIPAVVSTHDVSGLVLTQVGYNGAMEPRIDKGDVAVVIGDGLVGQWAAQVLRHRGAHVIMAGQHHDRLKIAQKYSADEIINSKENDLAEFIKERYPKGIPVVIETASTNKAIRTGIGLLRTGFGVFAKKGQFVFLGYYPEGECMVDIHWLRAKEITAYFPNGWARERMEKTMALISQKKMYVKELVTHTFPYTEAANAYHLILEKAEGFLGIVLNWKK